MDQERRDEMNLLVEQRLTPAFGWRPWGAHKTVEEAARAASGLSAIGVDVRMRVIGGWAGHG
jgi:hypothetical protein